MGLNYKLIQRFAKTSTSDVQHTSSYAKAQNSTSFGAAGAQSFDERQQIELQRKMVQGYKNARVAQGVNRIPKARTYAEELAIRKKAMENRRSSWAPEDYQEKNLKKEAGGLMKYDKNAKIGQANMRQQMAERFSAKARPVPKSGGFGRH
ncbi:hypothetical protein IK110_00480 [Candidatus Saccharibacteria bacterium]|nr:hypothetical protein [Candidatus Saccharibacteria bacterium]